MPDADPHANKNKLAFVLVILSKAFGIAGLLVGLVNRTAGGALLLFDGVLIAVSVTLCVRIGRAQSKEAADDKAVVARLVREGTLKQYLRDIEDEAREAARAARALEATEAAAE